MESVAGVLYIAVTGRPGVGKTTLFWKVVKRLVAEGVRVTGFYCPEVREAGRRIGFKIVLIDGSAEAWLARVQGCSGPRVGRYNTCQEAEGVAGKVLEQLDTAELVAIDEIGPMELRLAGVRSVIYRIFESGKPGFFVVHERLNDPLILPRLRRHGKVYYVTIENRDWLPEKVYAELRSILKR